MIILNGVAFSNYYNKVKIALLEKNIPFQERIVFPYRSPELFAQSPFGKIPYIETEHGILCESQVILEYLEQTYPAHPLLPRDSFQAAKARELIQFLELHVELLARQLYPEAFFGGKVPDDVKAKVEKQLGKNIERFAQVAQFSPYLVGSEFSMADCAGAAHFSLISLATKAIYGRDYLGELPVREYLNLVGQRPSVQKMIADRKAQKVSPPPSQ